MVELDTTGLNFECIVRTPLLPKYKKGKHGPWSFKQRSDDVIRGFMKQFTNKKTQRLLIAELRGAGIQFFKGAPDVFKNVFWALIDSKKRFKDDFSRVPGTVHAMGTDDSVPGRSRKS